MAEEEFEDADPAEAAYNFARFTLLAQLTLRAGVRKLGVVDATIGLDQALRGLAAIAMRGDSRLTPFDDEEKATLAATQAHFPNKVAQEAVRRVMLVANGQH